MLVPGDHAGEGLSTLAMRSVGYTRQPFQEYPHSVSTTRLSRHDSTQSTPLRAFPTQARVRKALSLVSELRVLQTAATHSLALSSGGHVISLDGGSRLQALHVVAPTPPAGCRSSTLGRRAGFLGRFLSLGSSVVVRRCPPGSRGSSRPSPSGSHPVHRRLGHGLGCVTRL